MVLPFMVQNGNLKLLCEEKIILLTILWCGYVCGHYFFWFPHTKFPSLYTQCKQALYKYLSFYAGVSASEAVNGVNMDLNLGN